jgi:hypothetical protein
MNVDTNSGGGSSHSGTSKEEFARQKHIELTRIAQVERRMLAWISHNKPMS